MILQYLSLYHNVIYTKIQTDGASNGLIKGNKQAKKDYWLLLFGCFKVQLHAGLQHDSVIYRSLFSVISRWNCDELQIILWFLYLWTGLQHDSDADFKVLYNLHKYIIYSTSWDWVLLLLLLMLVTHPRFIYPIYKL